jgi:hypothetical protein
MNRMMIRKLLIVGALSGGLVASAAGVAVAATGSPAAPAKPAAAVSHVSSPSDGPESSGEGTSHETDGPGGHQDAAGTNVDHQFNGTE